MKVILAEKKYQWSWVTEEEVLKHNITDYIEKANKKELRKIMEFITKEKEKHHV